MTNLKNMTTSPEKQQRTRRHALRFLAGAVCATLAAVFALHANDAKAHSVTCNPGYIDIVGTSRCAYEPDNRQEFADWCERNGGGRTTIRCAADDACRGTFETRCEFSNTSQSCSPFQDKGILDGDRHCRDNGATSCPAGQAYLSSTHACGTSAPGAPILTKPVAANWLNESFTLYWRPPLSDGGSPITGYRIYREQNSDNRRRTGHPHESDSNAFGLSLEQFARTLTVKSQWYENTRYPLQNFDGGLAEAGKRGQTHGLSYRWKIAAINEHGIGPAVTTDPILARGFITTENGVTLAQPYDTTRTDNNQGGIRVACPAGQYGVYGYQGDWGVGCAPPDRLAEAELCHALRDRNPSLPSAFRLDTTFEGHEGVCSINPPADDSTCADVGFRRLGSRAWYTDRLVTQQVCAVDNPCGVYSEYNIDHRECQCIGWAQPGFLHVDADSPSQCECRVLNADKTNGCTCPSGTAYSPENHACECTAAGRTFNQATKVCEVNQDSLDLAAEVVKTSPSLVSVRALLDAGASPNVLTNTVPVLLTAAALGHAQIVSVLITAGADPAAHLGNVFFDMNVALLMAARDGTAQPGGGELPRAERWNVLRHFGDALAVRGAAFDWNVADRNNAHATDLLQAAENHEPPESDPILLQMADYMLGRGMHCGHETTNAARYAKYCVGKLGKALADLVNTDDGVTLYSGEEVRMAAQAMVDAGISLAVAGVPDRGHLVGVAAFTGQGHALSVLLTFGMDPDGRAVANRNVLAHVGRAAGNSSRDPVKSLRVLQSFVGGLEAAGKLTGAGAYDGWNATNIGFPNTRPLDNFQTYASNNEGFDAEKDATHELFYENGARCASPGTKKYCQIPTQEITKSTRGVGPVLVLALARLGFRGLSSSVSTNLTMNGWTVTVDTGASPHQFILSRYRAHETGDAAAIFTVTMTSGHTANPDARVVAVSMTAEANPGYVSLVAAVTLGNAGEVAGLLNADLIDAVGPGGVPLLITAVVLGHADVVSVLLTGGYDPDTRSPFGGFNLNIPHLMATYDGTEQPGGGELSREKRLEVLRHFGDALEVLGTPYDNWNWINGHNFHFSDLLGVSEGRNHGTEAERLAMADYAASRGMNCGHKSGTAVYWKYCIGGLGVALYNAVTVGGADETAAVREAGVAMVEAGISVTIAGGVYGTVTTNVLGIAMHRLRQDAVGILVSLGAEPNTRVNGLSAPHIAARAIESDPWDALGMLQDGFIAGMLAAGSFSSFGGWNELVGGKSPLDTMQETVTSQSASAAKDGLHSLLYELGTRCATASGTYCELPRGRNTKAEPAMGVGAVLTVLSRLFSGFHSPPVGSGVSASLTANGWGVELRPSPYYDNPDMVLTRTRPGLETDAAAMFTVTLTSAAGPSRAVYVSATAAIESGVVSLAAAVGAGDLAGTRFWLATLGVNALGAESRDNPPVPLVIVAATAGHSDVLSVLITFGMDPNSRHPSASLYRHTAPFLMADFENNIALSRTERLDVIRHFGDAVKVRGTLFNWNAADDSGYYLSNLLRFSGAATADTGEHAVLLRTTDYLLAQGMDCGQQPGIPNRYQKYCVGQLGGVLVSLITKGGAVSDAEVRAAAQGMVDAGIPLEAAGDAVNGHLVPVAAFNRRASAVSILITFGMSPLGRRGNYAVPHIVSRNSVAHPAEMLSVLRAFVGGLSAAGKLAGFDWNARVQGGVDSALDLLDDLSVDPADEPAEKDEIHSLLYELGGRCVPMAPYDYCDVPADDFMLPLVSGAGAYFTLTARAFSGFQSPPIAAGVSATLEASGWGYALNTVAEPDELELNRIRLAAPSDAPAVFTVTLISNAGASREMRVWATVSQGEIPQAYYDLVTAVYEGDAEEIKRALDSGSALTDASDEDGVPLLIVAATLGYPEVVEVLISAGFTPGARSGGKTALDLMRDIYDDDETKQGAYDEIADLLLARGVVCSGGIEARYDPPCIGSFGAVLVGLMTMTVAILDSDVRAAAQGVVEAGVSLDFVGVDGKGELIGVGAGNGHFSAVSILLTFGMNPSGRGGNSGRTDWTALHHIAEATRVDATVALEALRGFVGALQVVGGLESFAGWNAEAGADGRPLDVFHDAASANSDSEEEKATMYELFFLQGAECANPGDKQYCGLPRTDYSFEGVNYVGAVVTLSGLGVEGEMFVLPGQARTMELYENGWVLVLDSEAEPPRVVLVRDAVGSVGKETVTVGLTLVAEGRPLRAYRVVARVEINFFDCAALNKHRPQGGVGGCGGCLDDTTDIEGECVRKDGDFRREEHETVCETYLGGVLTSGRQVCKGIDEAGTFCILNSRDAFPCRGLFRHVLRCNLTYNRVGLNAFACGRSCGEAGGLTSQTAKGGRCE